MRLAPGNPMNRALRAILAFEAVSYALAVPGMIQVSEVPAVPAIALGGASAVLALAAAGLLNRPIGWVLAWACQVAGVLLGLATPMMFWVGGMFAALFVSMVVLGRRLADRTSSAS